MQRESSQHIEPQKAQKILSHKKAQKETLWENNWSFVPFCGSKSFVPFCGKHGREDEH